MNRKGVTLVELIIVLVIIVIVAVLAAPHIAGWLPNYRLKGATRDIVSMMRVAQMKAVSNRTEHQISFNKDAGTYILQYKNTGGNWVDDPTTKMQSLPRGIQFSEIALPGNNAQFNINSTSSSGSISLKNKRGTTNKITLTPSTGRVKIND